jgi:DNA-binding transcriptional MerR regulator
MSRQELTIGQLARRAGCKIQTIRYYEEIGLMPKPPRTAGNQRRYGQRQAARLAFIRHSRELGFPLDAVRELLALADNPDMPCAAADAIAKRQLDEVQHRIKRLMALHAEFERMIAACRGGRIAECRIIEVIADSSHGHCLSDRHAVSEDRQWSGPRLRVGS